MQEAIAIFFLAMGCFASFLLVLGLVKPVLALWYLDRFNRLKVIKIHLPIMVICWILWLLIS